MQTQNIVAEPGRETIPCPALLEGGGVAVIVGARMTNVGEKLWHDPRFVFWQETADQLGVLPSNTRVIVFTRFMGHSAWDRLIGEARRRNLVVYHPGGTHKLRSILQGLVGQPSPTPAEPVTVQSAAVATVQEPAVLKRGDAIGWMREVVATNPMVTRAAMFELAKATDVPYSHTALNGAFYAARKELGLWPKPSEPALVTESGEADSGLRLVRSSDDPPLTSAMLAPIPAPPLVAQARPELERDLLPPITTLRPEPPSAPMVAAVVRRVLDPSATNRSLVELVDEAIAALQLIRELTVEAEALHKQTAAEKNDLKAKMIQMIDQM